jgi:hypothetical protein
VNEKIIVYVNDRPVTLFKGMQVKHALIAFDQSLYESAAHGKLAINDANGFRVGLDGAVIEGSSLYTEIIID